MSDSDSAPEELTFSESKKIATKRQLDNEKIKSEQRRKVKEQRRQKDANFKAQQPSKKLSEILAESDSETENINENGENELEEKQNERLVYPKELPLPGIQAPKIETKPKKTLFKDGSSLVRIAKPRKSAPPGRMASSKRDQLMYRKLKS